MTTVETPGVGAQPYPDEELDLDLRSWTAADHALPVPVPGLLQHGSARPLDGYLRDPLVRTGRADRGGDLRLFSPDETDSNRLGAVLEATGRCSMLPVQAGDEAIGRNGRVVLAAAGDVPTMEVLAAAELLREHVPHLRTRVAASSTSWAAAAR